MNIKYNNIKTHHVLLGQPNKAVIMANDSHVECATSLTSQPEDYRTAIQYTFIFGNKSVKQTNLTYAFEIPKVGPQFYVVCMGQEVGSKYISERSDKLFIDEKGESSVITIVKVDIIIAL